MVEVLDERESAPASYPAAPADLSTEAAALEPAVLWTRLESWMAYRWGERTVIWIVRGPGEWVPRLTPTDVDTAEAWSGDAWEDAVIVNAPIGYELGARTYRFTCTVGTDAPPPATVLEAYARLAEYTVGIRDDPVAGLTSVTDGDYSMARAATHAARALQYSGAADLLRSYRW